MKTEENTREHQTKSILRKLAAVWPHAPSLIIWRTFEAMALQDINLEQPILDLGCGDGIFFSEIFGQLSAHGCDINEEMLKRAARKGYASLTCCNVAELPYHDNSFRTVFSNCAIEHIDDIGNTMAEISRVLAPGGRFVFTVITPVFEKWFLEVLAGDKAGASRKASRKYLEYSAMQSHVNVHESGWWDTHLEKLGLSLEKVKHYITFNEFKAFLRFDRMWHCRVPLPGFWKTGGFGRLSYGLSLLFPKRAASVFWSRVLRESCGSSGQDRIEGPGMMMVAKKQVRR